MMMNELYWSGQNNHAGIRARQDSMIA